MNRKEYPNANEREDRLRNSLESARVELLDLGLRNKMVSWRPSRRYGVEIAGAEPAAIFDRLVRGTASFGFEPKPDSEDAPEAPAPASRRRNRLTTGVGANELQPRLLRTSAQARTLLEEQGVNTLFLALGMIEWYESESSQTPRRAPLLLVPVNLTRESVRSGFRMSWTGEDLGPNASFAAKSRADFGLNFPVIDENEIDDAEIEVDAYFDAVERAIADFPRWKARRDMAVVDFFSFSKLLMHADLDPENWLEEDGDAATESGVLDSLLGDNGFSDGGSHIGDGERLDDHLRPEDVHHVIDADSSQALAILEVGARTQPSHTRTARNGQIADDNQCDSGRRSRRQDGSVRRRKDGGAGSGQAQAGRDSHWRRLPRTPQPQVHQTLSAGRIATDAGTGRTKHRGNRGRLRGAGQGAGRSEPTLGRG